MSVRGPPAEAIVPVLTLLVVLSGCAGFSWPGSSQTATPEGTASEVSTSIATPTERLAETTSSTTPDATSSQTPSETVAGEVRAYRVESAPEGATVVPATDERIDVGGPVWQAIERAAESGTATIPIEGDGFREARATLRSLPSYSNGGEGGVYVRTNGTVVRLMLSVDL